MVRKRNTPQMLKVKEYLDRVRTHPTAEDVYSEVVKQIPTMTLATVYRNLHKLADSGEILKIEVNGEYHFDGDTCYHQHCVCKSCGKITDMFRENISQYAMKNLVSPDFTPECVTVIFQM